MLAIPSVALADDDLVLATAESETTETTEADIGIQPAVEADPAGGEDEEQPWTARFLAPLLLTIGVVGLALSAIGYLFRLKARYRVAE